MKPLDLGARGASCVHDVSSCELFVPFVVPIFVIFVIFVVPAFVTFVSFVVSIFVILVRLVVHETKISLCRTRTRGPTSDSARRSRSAIMTDRWRPPVHPIAIVR